MTTELLLALGIPAAYLLVSTALLLSRHKSLPPFLLRLSTEVDAFYWTVPAPDIVNSGQEEQGFVSV